MKHLSLLSAFIILASCANGPEPTPIVLQRMAQSGIDSRTYAKIHAGRILNYSDILDLVQQKIPDVAIVSYLKSTHAPYRFTAIQLEKLSDVGAGPTLANYLGKSVGYYEAVQRNQTGGPSWKHHPYFIDPYYGGEAPFDYAFPDEWYGPATLDMWF